MVKNHEGNAAVLDKPRVVQLAGTVSMTQAAGPSQEPVMEDDEEGGDGDADVEPGDGDEEDDDGAYAEPGDGDPEDEDLGDDGTAGDGDTKVDDA